MARSGPEASGNGGIRRAVTAAVAAVVVPLVLLAILRWQPALDVRWENNPAHFWLVLAAAAIATALGYAVTVAARRRQDARLFLIALAFIAGAGFLGLHALSTPGVLLGPNAGFELATPVGLIAGSAFVAVSGLDFSAAASRRLMARSRLMLYALFACMLVWAGVSLAELPPLNNPLQQEALHGWQLVFAALGAVGYGIGSYGYLRLYRKRGARFVLAVAVAFGLLAASMVVIAFAVNWQLSWWKWHVLMLLAFGLIAAAARQEWHEERFSALYLEQTLAGARDVSVLFADLEGFTTYSERTEPRAVKQMLDAYFARLIPLLEDLGGEVHRLIGDAIMVVFNKQGDQPEHALLAARAGLALQQAAGEVARAHPEWPRFRVGVNSGEALAGVLGDRGHRTHDVIGDSVNLAARLESEAPVGEVVIGPGTYSRLPEGASVDQLAPLHLKGKSEPVTGYILRGLPG
jgi:adenylate cyclase